MSWFSLTKRISDDLSEISPSDAAINPSHLEKLRDAQNLRYAVTLGGKSKESNSTGACRRAWKSLQNSMALVSSGTIELRSQAILLDGYGFIAAEPTKTAQTVEVSGFYVDRTTVTNHQFLSFVRSGGYGKLDYWPQEAWPMVVQFVDQSDSPGPRWWCNGRPSRQKLNHPVTGVNWFEATAYANWVGKLLPTSAQWQRACSWHASQQGHVREQNYPWGDSFDNEMANLSSSGVGSTVAVDQYQKGQTPNGVRQLIGNVWEWTDGDYVCPGAANETNEANSSHLNSNWGEIRGGAYDTYFNCQATSQFRTGQKKLFRGRNTGFRCVLPIAQITHAPV